VYPIYIYICIRRGYTTIQVYFKFASKDTILRLNFNEKRPENQNPHGFFPKISANALRILLMEIFFRTSLQESAVHIM